MNKQIVPILIPSYEPDERLITLLENKYFKEQFVVLIDDGSGIEYNEMFERAQVLIDGHGVLLRHDENKGKGGALKTGFKWILENMPDCEGCVTADSDGQHSPSSIENVKTVLINNPSHLIMGVRDFSGDDIPFKSRLGNNLILFLMRIFGGVKGSDVQTGLRGIPIDFMPALLNIASNRFEYETEMLLIGKRDFPTIEVPIDTIYDSKDNHQTHYSPIKDSMKIGWVLMRHFVGFICSSLSSSVVDITLFALFCKLFKGAGILLSASLYITVSAILARIISATYNYYINYRLVFRSQRSIASSLSRYALTAIIIMMLSATLTTIGAVTFARAPEVLVKIVVDIILFLLSYSVQKNLVF